MTVSPGRKVTGRAAPAAGQLPPRTPPENGGVHMTGTALSACLGRRCPHVWHSDEELAAPYGKRECCCPRRTRVWGQSGRRRRAGGRGQRRSGAEEGRKGDGGRGTGRMRMLGRQSGGGRASARSLMSPAIRCSFCSRRLIADRRSFLAFRGGYGCVRLEPCLCMVLCRWRTPHVWVGSIRPQS